MAREPNAANGQLLALDTETGEELWTFTSDSYSWSTPTCFYDTKGNGYVLYTSCINGKMYMVDGLTGEVYDTFSFGCTMEASPVVYNNTVVIGTRSEQVYGITLE
jgi:outer membrane protein assembly factor BamB